MAFWQIVEFPSENELKSVFKALQPFILKNLKEEAIPTCLKITFDNILPLIFFQVSRIARHQHVPRHVKTAREELRTIKESRARKEANRRRHAKPGTVPYVPEREKHIVDEKE